MAKGNFNDAEQAQVLSSAATTVEEASVLLGSYVDLMLDVALGGVKNPCERIYALLIATQAQIDRLETIPDVLMSASAAVSSKISAT